MTSKRTLDLSAPLNPDFFYRKHSPVAMGVIGLAPSQIDEKIKSGELPPPMAAFESGRATGWTGAQLIAFKEQRLARALAAEVEPEPVEAEPRKRAAAARRASGKPVTALETRDGA
jgi:predicted DNA-binding transcriptional regulator AlpA